MIDEVYWAHVDTICRAVETVTLEENVSWNQDVVHNWRYYIAPDKHADYGIECWERLGPKALVADVSAVFYRYKNLYGRHPHDRALLDAIIDAFGYAVIFTVTVIERSQLTQPDLEDIYDEHIYAEEVGATNELVIRQAWDNDRYVDAVGPVMRQARNMWKGCKP